MNYRHAAAALLAPSVALACPAHAAPKQAGDPVAISGTVTIDPIVDARLRYEGIDQPTVDADALTLRVRSGAELRHAPSNLAFLVEAEGTLGLVADYNAFPFAIVDAQRRPQFATVPDAADINLNRVQVQYRTKNAALTVGRQRINIDDQRWVGSVAWRQNEQTFDAVRAEATLGPVALDAVYANSQHTIFGEVAGPRAAYDGDFVFLNGVVKAGPVSLRGFTYLLDYDPAFALANSSQTYGAKATASIPLGKSVKFNLMGSYARQSDYGANPVDYAADYVAGEAGIGVAGFTLTGGYELLGSDATATGGPKALQTPLATLHKFNGFADLFLTTPAAGLEDKYVTLAKTFPKVKALPGLAASVTWHRFASDIGNQRYGEEWDATLGFRQGRVGLLAKFADYNAQGFGVDRRIFWLQAEYSL